MGDEQEEEQQKDGDKVDYVSGPQTKEQPKSSSIALNFNRGSNLQARDTVLHPEDTDKFDLFLQDYFEQAEMEREEYEQVHGKATDSQDGTGSEWTDRRGFVNHEQSTFINRGLGDGERESEQNKYMSFDPDTSQDEGVLPHSRSVLQPELKQSFKQFQKNYHD